MGQSGFVTLTLSIERLWQDLRHGARMSARNPALATICVVSIAFGTGANVATFSTVDALLLRRRGRRGVPPGASRGAGEPDRSATFANDAATMDIIPLYVHAIRARHDGGCRGIRGRAACPEECVQV
jgi:hypothetical protein